MRYMMFVGWMQWILGGWPSDASAHCYYGTKEQYLKECENDWEQSRFWRSRYKNKAEYMAVMKKHYRKGINK